MIKSLIQDVSKNSLSHGAIPFWSWNATVLVFTNVEWNIVPQDILMVREYDYTCQYM